MSELYGKNEKYRIVIAKLESGLILIRNGSLEQLSTGFRMIEEAIEELKNF